MRNTFSSIIKISTALALAAAFVTCAPPAVYYRDPGVSGTVPAGECLVFRHNLGRDDLTFTAQFVRDGMVYDYNDFDRVFPPVHLAAGPVEFADESCGDISTLGLSSGRVVIFYRDAGNIGFFIIYNERGGLESGPHRVTDGPGAHFNVVELPGGDLFIAYRDVTAPCYGLFSVFSQSGERLSGPSVFENTGNGFYFLSVSPFQNGNVLIAYGQIGGEPGWFSVYNRDGSLVAGPTQFTSMLTQCVTLSLPDGNAFLMYGGYDDGRSYPGLRVITPDGTMSASTGFGADNFLSEMGHPLSAARLPDGNAFIGYHSGGFYYDLVTPQRRYLRNHIAVPGLYRPVNIAVVPFANRGILYLSANYGGEFVVYDYLNDTLSPPYRFFSCSAIDPPIVGAAFPNGNALLAWSETGGPNGYHGVFTIYERSAIRLEKVSNNEARLWNRTGEPLAMMLTVNR